MSHFRKKLSGVAIVGLVCVMLPFVSAPAQATTAARMTLTPATKTVVKQTAFNLVVKVNTGGQAVNAVQFYIDLPSTRLNCKSITLLPDGWPNSGPKTCNGTTAAFVAYSNGGTSFTGIARVAKIRLQATNVTGSATVAFNRSKTFVVSATTNQDILGSTNQTIVTVTP